MANKNIFAPPTEEELNSFNLKEDKNIFAPPSEEELNSIVSKNEPQIEAGLYGAAQGMSLGLTDELVGASVNPKGAAKETLNKILNTIGTSTIEDKDVQEYREARDFARNLFKQTEKEQPKTYLGGSLLGSIPTAIGAGGIGLVGKGIPGALKAGAAFGGAQAVGESEAKNVQDILKDIGSGAVLGAGTGAALSGIGAIGKTGFKSAQNVLGNIKESPHVSDILESFKYGKKGISIGSKDVEKLDTKLRQMAPKIIDKLENEKKQVSKLYDDILGASDKEIEAKDFFNNMYEKVNKLPELLPEQRSDKERLLQFLNERRGMKEVEKTAVQTVFKPKEFIIPGEGAYPEQVIPTTTKKITELPYTAMEGAKEKFTGKELKNIVTSFKDLSEQMSTSDAAYLAKGLTSQARSFSKEAIPGLKEADAQYKLINDILENIRNVDRTSEVKESGKLVKLIEDLSKQTESGKKSKALFNEIIQKLEKVNPQKAQAMEKVLPELSKQYRLAQETTKSGFGSTLIGGGLGTLVGSAFGPIGSGAGGAIGAAAGSALKLSSKGLATSGANVLGKAIHSAPQIQQIANTVASKGKIGMDLSAKLLEAANKDEQARNAALFALEQSPEYRKVLHESLGIKESENE